MDRKKVILLILVLLFGISLTYRLMNPYKQPRVTHLKYSPTSQAGRKQNSKSNATHDVVSCESALYLLTLLGEPPVHQVKVIKNPFFRTQPKKEAPRPDDKNIPKPIPPTGPKPQDPKEKVKRDLSRFRVFGFFESNGKVTLFLEKDKNILIIREGDWIEGRYRVIDITTSALRLKAPEIGEEIHIDLSD